MSKNFFNWQPVAFIYKDEKLTVAASDILELGATIGEHFDWDAVRSNKYTPHVTFAKQAMPILQDVRFKNVELEELAHILATDTAYMVNLSNTFFEVLQQAVPPENLRKKDITQEELETEDAKKPLETGQ